MSTKIITAIIFLIGFMLIAITARAQDDYRVLYYDGPTHQVDQAKVVLVDGNNNMYVTGSSYGANKEDYLTIKYNPYGEVLWTARLDGAGHDYDMPYAMKVDAAGNVYVTGTSRDNNQANSEDFLTVKYSPAGVQLWANRYDAPQAGDCNYTYDVAYAIDVDASGNVYVTGGSRTTNTSDDFLTVKYNPSGTILWVARYNGPSNLQDVAKCLQLDGLGGVIVAGQSFKTGQDYDYVAIKYNTSGVAQWTTRYNGPANGADSINSMTLDNQGNVLVTGSSKGITSGQDYATLKLLNTTGAIVWTSRFNGVGNGTDEAKALAIDDYGFIYVTGASFSTISNLDFVTIKYAQDGTEMWTRNYNGTGNGIDKASAIKIRKMSCINADVPCLKFDIYVTGQSIGAGTGNDYATIKYDQDGNTKWEKRFNRSGASDDVPTSMAIIEKTEFIFITGTSANDYATFWYVPFTAPNRLGNAPKEFTLQQNYPNPFNPATKISFSIPRDANVKLTIYNALGELTETLNDGLLPAGDYNLSWDGSNYNSGVYFYKLEAGSFISTKKMILIK